MHAVPAAVWSSSAHRIYKGDCPRWLPKFPCHAGLHKSCFFWEHHSSCHWAVNTSKASKQIETIIILFCLWNGSNGWSSRDVNCIINKPWQIRQYITYFFFMHMYLPVYPSHMRSWLPQPEDPLLWLRLPAGGGHPPGQKSPTPRFRKASQSQSYMILIFKMYMISKLR